MTRYRSYARLKVNTFAKQITERVISRDRCRKRWSANRPFERFASLGNVVKRERSQHVVPFSGTKIATVPLSVIGFS